MTTCYGVDSALVIRFVSYHRVKEKAEVGIQRGIGLVQVSIY